MDERIPIICNTSKNPIKCFTVCHLSTCLSLYMYLNVVTSGVWFWVFKNHHDCLVYMDFFFQNGVSTLIIFVRINVISVIDKIQTKEAFNRLKYWLEKHCGGITIASNQWYYILTEQMKKKLECVMLKIHSCLTYNVQYTRSLLTTRQSFTMWVYFFLRLVPVHTTQLWIWPFCLFDLWMCEFCLFIHFIGMYFYFTLSCLLLSFWAHRQSFCIWFSCRF